MENEAPYSTNAERVYFSTESLQPFDRNWRAPQKDEIRIALDKGGLDPRQAADFLGVSRKVVNSWTIGAETIPFACWALLCRRAGVGFVDDWW